jgi:dolichol kinase
VSRELHEFLRRIDPARFREDADREARAQLELIRERVLALFRAVSEAPAGTKWAVLREKLAELIEAIDRASSHKLESAKKYWAAFQKEVHPAYESLAAWLSSASLPAQSLRPTNHARMIFHMTSASLALIVISLAPSPGWITLAASLFFFSAWTMELLRRGDSKINDRLMAFFGPVAHAHERHRVNSATWYATALMALSLFCAPPVSAMAVAVLGLGDPAAAFIGRRYGRIRLYAGRSLEGSLTFLFVAAAVAMAVAHFFLHVAWPLQVAAACVAGLSGAVAELFSKKLDDNLTIPLTVAASVSALLVLCR